MPNNNDSIATHEQRYPIRGQGQPQPEQSRSIILGGSLRQAQPDSLL